MNRTQLVRALAERCEMTQREASRVVSTLFDPREGLVPQALASGSAVAIRDFGTFEAKPVKARLGRNPNTGEPVQIPPGRRPAFRPAAALRRVVEP